MKCYQIYFSASYLKNSEVVEDEFMRVYEWHSDSLEDAFDSLFYHLEFTCMFERLDIDSVVIDIEEVRLVKYSSGRRHSETDTLSTQYVKNVIRYTWWNHEKIKVNQYR